jgi:hypothetical protein
MLHAIHSPFYWPILKEFTIFFSGFKNPCKKNPRNKKTRVENQTKTRVWEDLNLCPESSTKMPFMNSISGHSDKKFTWKRAKERVLTSRDGKWKAVIRIRNFLFPLHTSDPRQLENWIRLRSGSYIATDNYWEETKSQYFEFYGCKPKIVTYFKTLIIFPWAPRQFFHKEMIKYLFFIWKR